MKHQRVDWSLKTVLTVLILACAVDYTEGACTKEQLRELSQYESSLPRLYADVRQAKVAHGSTYRGVIQDNSQRIALTESVLEETRTKWEQLRQECRTPERDRLEASYRQIERELTLARAAEREAARPQQEVLDRLAKMEQLQQEQARKSALDAGIAETQRKWELDDLAARQRSAQWQTENRIRDLERKANDAYYFPDPYRYGR